MWNPSLFFFSWSSAVGCEDHSSLPGAWLFRPGRFCSSVMLRCSRVSSTPAADIWGDLKCKLLMQYDTQSTSHTTCQFVHKATILIPLKPRWCICHFSISSTFREGSVENLQLIAHHSETVQRSERPEGQDFLCASINCRTVILTVRELIRSAKAHATFLRWSSVWRSFGEQCRTGLHRLGDDVNHTADGFGLEMQRHKVWKCCLLLVELSAHSFN